MSDEREDVTPGPATEPTPAGAAEPTPAEPADAAESTAAATPAARPRPANPSAAAARRARQLGGTTTRRPLPHARPGTAEDGAGSPPRPRPTPAGRAADTTKPASRTGRAAARKAAGAGTATTASAVEAPPRPRNRVLLGATVLLTVALLAVGVVFLVLTLTATPQLSAEQTERALAAAKTDVALVTSYGYQTIDSDAAKAAAVLTGQFRTQYLQSIDQAVKPQLPSSETVTTGQVDTAGLVSADPKGSQVVVLVYGQQSVTNKAQTTPRIDAFQIRVTMQLVGSSWLVSNLEQLGNNA